MGEVIPFPATLVPTSQAPTSPGGVILPHPSTKIASVPGPGGTPAPGSWNCPRRVRVDHRRLADGTLVYDLVIKVAPGARPASRSLHEPEDVAYWLKELRKPDADYAAILERIGRTRRPKGDPDFHLGVSYDMTLAELFYGPYLDEFYVELGGYAKIAYARAWNSHVAHPERGVAQYTLRQLCEGPGRLRGFRRRLIDAGVSHHGVNAALDLVRTLLFCARTLGGAGVTTTPFELGQIKFQPRKRIGRVLAYGPRASELFARQMIKHSRRDWRERLTDAMVVRIGFGLGVRPGELRAIQTDHVGQTSVVIEQACKHPDPDEVRESDGKLELVHGDLDRVVLGPTKTGKSRPVKAPQLVLDDIEEFCDLMELRNGAFLFESLVTHAGWLSWRSSAYRSARNWMVEDHPEIKHVGVCRLYDLTRHSHASMRIRAGWGARNEAKLAGHLGHSIRTLQEVYLHELTDYEDVPDHELLDFDVELERARMEVHGTTSLSDLLIQYGPRSRRTRRKTRNETTEETTLS
jgi:integrase